jgi:hypothetical protein
LFVVNIDGRPYQVILHSPWKSFTQTEISPSNFPVEIRVGLEELTEMGVVGGRSGMTYGIVVRGKFLDAPTADEVVFGNVFERPIRDSLPWGTAVAVKFMK